jgi:hypothetical protein
MSVEAEDEFGPDAVTRQIMTGSSRSNM